MSFPFLSTSSWVARIFLMPMLCAHGFIQFWGEALTIAMVAFCCWYLRMVSIAAGRTMVSIFPAKFFPHSSNRARLMPL